MATEPSGHQLSATENERIFRQQIVPATLSQAARQPNPLVVFLGGQTGAGKTAVAQMITAAMSRRGAYTNINMDFYNPHHPQFARWQAEDETTASRNVRPDGDIWWQKAQQYAISRRSDVVLETAMAAPSEYAEPALQFRAGDYQVETAFMAVPAALSRLGILSRFQGEVEAYGHGRYIEPAVHDRSYEGVLQAAAALDRDGLSDTVFVFRRDGSSVYRNHRSPDGTWQDRPSTVEAIQGERERPWSHAEGFRFLAQAQYLDGRIDPSLREELADVRRLAIPLLPVDLQQAALPAGVSVLGAAVAPSVVRPAQVPTPDLAGDVLERGAAPGPDQGADPPSQQPAPAETATGVTVPGETRLQAAARTAAAGRDREQLLQNYRDRGSRPGPDEGTPADSDSKPVKAGRARPAPPADEASRQDEARRRAEETRHRPEHGRGGPRL